MIQFESRIMIRSTNENFSKIIYPELSYEIVGIVYDVYNELGYGYSEKHYEKAIAIRLEKENINFKEQLRTDLYFDGKILGKYFLDFLIEGKIVLELKVGHYLHKKYFDQIKSYLKANNLELGLIILFTNSKVEIKRVLNRVSE